jgi:light-regulated signal transduction histidine kinase (bacteriophytochrome)
VAAATIAIAGAVFGGVLGARGIADPLVFICLPRVLWAGVRFSQREAAVVSLLLMAVAMRGSLLGEGPFAGLPESESLLLLQAFAAITSVTGQVLAAAIAGQRRLERELSQRARELTRSNQELEEFAYVTAHDLQEPARMIVSYLQLIERRMPELEPTTRDRFAMVTASASRMQGMIKAILDYSRIGKEEASQSEVDLGEIVRQALEDLAEKIRAEGATVEVGALPRVHGSATQLRRLFQNLVANALKFRAERPPRVSISAERGDGAWVIGVADNGIGIAKGEGQRLFGLFQRLHNADAYPGHGIGLATCKKVVEAHGGRIWFESEPGQGTNFRFTIPDRAKEL